MAALPKIGKRGERNQGVNLLIKRIALEMSLPEQCELQLKGCRDRQPPIDIAHSVRRWKWGNDPVLPYEAVFACRNCHDKSDGMKNHGAEIIRARIKARGWCFSEFVKVEKQTCPCAFCDCPNPSEFSEICGFCLLGCRGTEERRAELELNRV